MQQFRDVIDECNFMDLGFLGPKYTWSRHFENGHSIRERLDRCLATNSWFLKFLGTKVYHLRCDSLDHSPLHIVFSGIDPSTWKRLFRFEEMWLSHLGCEEVVQATWTSVEDLGFDDTILAKVEKCGTDLGGWNKDVFGSVRKELDRLKKNLVKAETEAMASGNNHRIWQLKREIEVLLERKAIMWAQRSRVLWAKQGDRNTKYFHSCATRRYRKNMIKGIRDEENR